MPPLDPTDWLGRPLPDLLAGLRDRPAGEEEGRVEWHAPAPTTEFHPARLAGLLTTCPADADLPADHPDVDVPGVVLEELLGAGGQGWVYAGRVRATGKLVAVKVLRGGSAGREADVCRRFRHRHILRVFRAEPAGACSVVVMELVRGRELTPGVAPDGGAAACFAALADALRALAAGRVVHRDVKPANVLVRAADGSPVLVDFGLAVDFADAGGPPPVVSGTPLYMAPEAFADRPVPEPSWDAYALGVTLAEVLTGPLPEPASLAALRRDKTGGAFDRLVRERLRGAADPGLAAWAGGLIAADPADRLAALAGR